MEQTIGTSVIGVLKTPVAGLSWVGPSPRGEKRMALLVPQYNEASNGNFESRLQYFASLSATFGDEIDLIIIDDGSTDDSLKRVTEFLEQSNDAFFLATVWPNSNKVGALHLTAINIQHEFVVLSDFDTDIEGYEKVITLLDQLSEDNTSMGIYFRMLPYEGNGNVFLFQQIEYALQRSLYKFYKPDGSVPVMPGAGACYKRAELLAIYSEHSGLRNGEDREATMIGLKLGYRTHYKDEVLTLTRPPLTFRTLIRQRVRWNLGYLETWQKERKYYGEQVRKLNRIGLVFMFDLAAVVFMIALPLLIIILAIVNIRAMFILVGLTYFLGLLSCICSILVAPKEFSELKGKLLRATILYPFMKLLVGYVSWKKAVKAFIRKQFSSARSRKV